MQIIASGRASSASSGMISGVGLASAITKRIARHALEHGGLEDAAGREAEENVGAGNNVRERARARLPRVDRLPAVHQFLAALIDDALDVADDDVLALGAERDDAD